MKLIASVPSPVNDEFFSAIFSHDSLFEVFHTLFQMIYRRTQKWESCIYAVSKQGDDWTIAIHSSQNGSGKNIIFHYQSNKICFEYINDSHDIIIIIIIILAITTV